MKDDRITQLILMEADARQKQLTLRQVVGMEELIQRLGEVAEDCRRQRLMLPDVVGYQKRARK